MASVRKSQEEALAYIDTAEALISKVVGVLDASNVSSNISMNFSINPVRFLIDLLSHLRFSTEDIENYIVAMLTGYVQIAEMSVKALILTSLKNMISCSIDPRIPEQYRKRHVKFDDSDTRQTYGIDIDIESIDFIDKLSVNPLDVYGKRLYFGTENVFNSYAFARADDMDAFLWFVIHKGKFPNSSKINDMDDLKGMLGASSLNPHDSTLLSSLEVIYNSNNDEESKILPGNTFVYNGGYVVSMCLDHKVNNEMKIISDRLVPVSDDWHSVNWYKRNYFERIRNQLSEPIRRINKNPNEYSVPRDYSKEKPIFNLQYIDQMSNDADFNGLVNNRFRFTILPRPLVHIPNISSGEPPWRFKKMLFNDKGEYDPNGKYTLNNNTDSADLSYLDGNVIINPRNGNVTVGDKNEVIKNLIECYPGLTLFEFNYDYLTSVKLFDARSLLYELFSTIFNTNISVTFKHREETDEIKTIIKSIIESDDSELNDCYYSFDSSKYAPLLKKAEEERAKKNKICADGEEGGLFDSVDEILSEYEPDAKLHEQQTILRRAIRQASVIITEGVDERNKVDIQYNFLLDLIENLTTAIVNAIMTPKVLMLLEVNKQMMGNSLSNFTNSQSLKELGKKSFHELIRQFSDIIKGIVKEVRDLVLQELQKLVLKGLEPIVETIESIILREQLETYSDIILDLIRNYPRGLSMFRSTLIDTQLDNVDYADIDVGNENNNDGETPSTNKC